MAKRRQRKTGRRFIQLWSSVKRSEAYHGLSLGARCALLELLDKYDGCNNGIIPMGARELGLRLRCGKDSASRFLRELDDAKLAHPTKVGQWRGRRPTTWRVTFYRCDLTGELPTLNWTPLSVRSQGRESPISGTQRSRQSDLRDASSKFPNKPHRAQSDLRDDIQMYTTTSQLKARTYGD